VSDCADEQRNPRDTRHCAAAACLDRCASSEA